MESNILNRINKLKQDLTSINSNNPRKSEDLAAYLSQSFKKPGTPELSSSNPSHFRQILDEKQARIAELEEEISYLRESSKNREQDITAKYEKAIESIKTNCDGLIKYYENQFSKMTIFADNGDLDGILDSIKSLERENAQLKSELKAQQNHFKKERSNLEQEISLLKDKYSETIEEGRLEKIDESMEIEELKEIKDKLEKEIANLQRSKNEYLNDVVEDYEEKYAKSVKSAESWKSKFDQLAFKFFKFLKNIKIEIFEIKNEVLTNFEDAITNASSIMMRLHKKYKTAIDSMDIYLRELIKDNQKMKAYKKKPRNS